jgi:hypothetical protein
MLSRIFMNNRKGENIEESYILRNWFTTNKIVYVFDFHNSVHHNELNCLYSLPNMVRVIKSRRLRWAGHVARMGEGRGVYRVLVGKPEGNRPLGRSRLRCEDNNRMDLQEVGGGCEDWIGLAQDRDRWRALVSAVRNLRVPQTRRIS